MNIWKIKKQITPFLVDIDKKFIEAKGKKAKQINSAIRERQSESVDFDKAAVDVILERLVEIEAAVELVKDFLGGVE